jgi:hypothetical protein
MYKLCAILILATIPGCVSYQERLNLAARELQKRQNMELAAMAESQRSFETGLDMLEQKQLRDFEAVKLKRKKQEGGQNRPKTLREIAIENCKQIDEDKNNNFHCAIYKEGNEHVVKYSWARITSSNPFALLGQHNNDQVFLRGVMSKNVIIPFCKYHVQHGEGDKAFISASGMRLHSCRRELELEETLHKNK